MKEPELALRAMEQKQHEEEEGTGHNNGKKNPQPLRTPRMPFSRRSREESGVKDGAKY